MFIDLSGKIKYMDNTLIRKNFAWLPIVISLLALVLVIGHVIIYGNVASGQDEGVVARLFQIMMLVQVFIMFLFGIKYFPKQPKETLMIICIQLIAALMPIFLILYLES